MNRWVENWQTWLELKKELAPATCGLYRRYVETLERDPRISRPLEDLDASDLRSWLQAQGGSSASYGNRVAALRSFYGYMAEQWPTIVKDDPSRTLQIPRRDPSGREPVRDLAAKLRLLDELDERVGRRVGESRDMAVFLVETGMHVSDACKLRPPVRESVVVARRRGPDREIQLSDEARGALERLGGTFGIGTRALQRRFEKAGFHPDQLRHLHRIWVAARSIGENERDLLGHRSDSSKKSTRTNGSEPVDQQVETVAIGNDPLAAVGGFLKLAEVVTSVLVREALRQGKTWADIAGALSIPEATARERFAA